MFGRLGVETSSIVVGRVGGPLVLAVTTEDEESERDRERETRDGIAIIPSIPSCECGRM